MSISSKLPNVGTTIFTTMSKLASDCGAINLSQGFPGFDCDPVLVELVTKHMKAGLNQYAPMSGVPILREQIAVKTKLVHSVDLNSETEVTVVSGATEAIYAAVTAVVKQGDEVILFDPAYDCYAPAIELNGGKPVYVPLETPDFSVNWDKVKAAISEKTRLIMVNTPHNPSGYVWTSEDINTLVEFVENKDILIVSDEVYEHITFDGRKHLSLLTHLVLRERTFVCGSFGKTFHVTGWKIGYCLAPPKLTEEFRKIHQFLTFSSATPLQYALADYLSDPSHYLTLPDFYQKKRDLFCEGLKNTRFEFSPAQGSFFQMVSYANLSEESDYELAVRLTKEIGVASIPISVFFSNKKDYKILRFCFAKKDSDLIAALDKLQRFEL
ncbi:methionine aminotransferase [Algoriphagus ratkowskyi]|uniref:Aminotransferase class I/II-fold pyridoxal phosphate-dependent enzyme n=1 Tax=Algoriphagus ratkowskyi TaxID=57028 RepID=A0A2W7R0C8_9BACT|nr:methionine aminotransferase [Algoriphagus ratkowskyi]PZX53974.1 methionine aminotransferase [Algoriphagus ratkowskyi]TXD76627.1 aminotransferase class I/II-fold pyridoxal phosphate-dependent enzyme [Algoriphagus ratkowskyi]